MAALVAGLVLTASLLALTHRPDSGPGIQNTRSLTLWQAYSRGLVTITMVDLTFQRGGSTVTEPAGIRVTNAATLSVVVPEEAVLMSPHLGQSPVPDPLSTTQDAVLTNASIPAGTSLTYVYGLYELLGLLSGPTWWCLEEMQFSKAGVPFALGGETLPFALRPLVEHPYFANMMDNSQTALWAYFRNHASVVVEKLPLESDVNASGDDHIRVRLDATNLAVWSTDDNVTSNVNITGGVLEDDVLPGWSVEPGSYSVAPSGIVNHSDGSKTLRWLIDIPGAEVSESGNPEYPTPYVTVTRSFTLVSPALNGTQAELPAARSDMNDSGTTDAHSAPVEITILGGTPPPPPAELARSRIGVRLAGEKGGEVNLTVGGNGTVLATLHVEREAGGGPNSASTSSLTFNLSNPVSVDVIYAPGKPHGSNPAWITVKFPDGTKIVFFHNFNAEHASSWTWNSGDLRPLFHALNETVPAGAMATTGAPSQVAAQAIVWLAATAPGSADPLSTILAKFTGQKTI